MRTQDLCPFRLLQSCFSAVVLRTPTCILNTNNDTRLFKVAVKHDWEPRLSPPPSAQLLAAARLGLMAASPWQSVLEALRSGSRRMRDSPRDELVGCSHQSTAPVTVLVTLMEGGGWFKGLKWSQPSQQEPDGTDPPEG